MAIPTTQHAPAIDGPPALQPARRPLIVAHRGASAEAPENTPAAFRLAIEQQADAIELDCRLTRDGAVVVLHDARLERTTDGRGEVRDWTLAQIRRLNAAAHWKRRFPNERVPVLGEVLDLTRGRAQLFIELKPQAPFSERGTARLAAAIEQDTEAGELPAGSHTAAELARIEATGDATPALARATIDAVVRAGMQRDVTLMCFSPVGLAAARLVAPDMTVAMLADAWLSRWRGPRGWQRAEVWCDRLALGWLNALHRRVWSESIERQHAVGRRVGVWTVDDAARMRRLAEWGADAITTNRPALARAVLG